MRGSQSLTTSRSSTTASGSTRRWATAPRSKYSPNTRRQQPLHDQLPEKLSKIVDTPQSHNSDQRTLARPGCGRYGRHPGRHRRVGHPWAAGDGVGVVEATSNWSKVGLVHPEGARPQPTEMAFHQVIRAASAATLVDSGLAGGDL